MADNEDDRMTDDKVTLTPAARAILDNMIALVDRDPRIERTFSEADHVEFALRFMEYCDTKLNDETPIRIALLLTVRDFENARKATR